MTTEEFIILTALKKYKKELEEAENTPQTAGNIQFWDLVVAKAQGKVEALEDLLESINEHFKIRTKLSEDLPRLENTKQHLNNSYKHEQD